MKNIKRLLNFNMIFLLISLIYSSCNKEINLTEFQDQFGDYRSELRVEAILDPVNPVNSIIRLDRSIRIDDTEIFNGLDDDGDWVSFSDDNNNGKWDAGEALNDDLGADGMEGASEGFPAPDEGEGNGRPDYGEPHVDEADEVLPAIHDTSATIYVRDIQNGDMYNFQWVSQADSFQITFKEVRGPVIPDSMESVYYGGYRPAEAFTMSYDHNYELYIYSQQFDIEISAETQALPPPVFIDENFDDITADTLYFNYEDQNFLLWKSDLAASTYYLKIEYVRGDTLLYLDSGPSFPLEEFNQAGFDYLIGINPIGPMFNEGTYKITISVLNEDYGSYYYSTLALDDPEKSNLRDQDGNVVMGNFGTIASTSKFLVIK